jgi:ATP-binding cassette subfamily B protein
MVYQRQIDETDCGPACIAMAASHFRLFVTIGQIRELCKTDYIGTNMAGMTRAAEQLGFNAMPLRGEVDDASLNKKLVFPFIAHVKIVLPDDTELDHYVVIVKITAGRVFIWDPDPSRGKYSLSRTDFLKIWTGYILFLAPGKSFKPGKNTRISLFKFYPLVVPHTKLLAVVCLASMLLILFGIVTSYYYKYIIDEVIISKASFTLAAFSLGMILLLIFQVIVEVLRGILINYFSFKVNLQLNFSYITHVFKLPISFFDTRKTGDILSRLTDIAKIQEMLSGTALSLMLDCVLIIVVGPLLFSINSLLFAVSISNVVVMSAVVLVFSNFFKRYFMQLRKEEAEVNSSLVEAIGGAYTVKALNAEKTIGRIYEEKQMRATWSGWGVTRLVVGQRFLAGIISGATSIIIFWAGSSGIIKDTFSFGTLLSFNALLVYFTGPLFRMINIQPQIQEASIAAERVSEILDMEVEQPEGMQLFKPAVLEGDIDFSHISFKYGMRPPVYRDLSFHINKGQWAAFVGPSGCGKTTLVKLLLKFYKPEQGTISIDGRDIRDIDAASLRARIGYVPQDIFIFAGTIAENIALHNPSAPMDEIISAAEKAGADEFIGKLPKRYNTKLSEQGSTLSGGERQRLALARALLGGPDIIILDEATSSLDSVSEKLVHQVIEKLRGNMTALIIAHRLTTIRNCDIIFVMDKGEIVESGSHEGLLTKQGLYKTLWGGMEA